MTRTNTANVPKANNRLQKSMAKGRPCSWQVTQFNTSPQLSLYRRHNVHVVAKKHAVSVKTNAEARLFALGTKVKELNRVELLMDWDDLAKNWEDI